MNKRRKNHLRVPQTAFSVLLAFLLAWGSMPVPALAEAAIELEGDTSAQTESIDGLVGEQVPQDSQNPQNSQGTGYIEEQDDDLGASNDELFESYIQQQFNKQLPGSADDIDVTTQSAGEYLTDAEFAIYDMLRQAVQQIACGEEASTIFELPLDVVLSKSTWTFAEVGVANPLENGSLTNEAKAAIGAKWSEEAGTIIYNALQAVRADCPYDMYWYGRSYSTPYGFSYSSESFTITRARICLGVATNYAAGDCTVNTTLAQSVQAAVTRATNIANDHKHEPTSVMLTSYKQAICGLASYNDAARDASSIADFGTNNPWELVWVFDDDENTSVVCEGYSKAFKYLCDLSGRTDVECLTVTGDMGNELDPSEMGGHMWNVVRMPDGKNYLVDVTNCDEGSAGYPDYLFLKGYAEGGYANDYYGFVTCSKTGKNYFTYNGIAKLTYPQADLELSSADYDPVYDVTPGKQSISPEVTIQGWTYGQAANAPQLTEGSNPGNGAVTLEYKVAGASDDTYATKVPTSAGSYTVRATVAETDTYLSGTATANFTIAKATPNLGTVTAGDVVDDLDASKVVLSRTNTSVEGTLILVETTLQYGTNTYNWTFVPSDTANYNTATGTVSITVSGHSWGAAEYEWSANKSSVTATRVCKNNSAHKETETVNTTSAVTTAATCTESGTRTYTATFLNAAFATQTQEETIPAEGHDWGEWQVTTPATATQAGEETRECSKCHATETRPIPPLDRIDISGATMGLSASSFTYDGTEHVPGVTVSLDGTKLDWLLDYDVTYKNNVNAGTATVVVTGCGDYTGTASTTFTIAKASQDIELIEDDFEVTYGDKAFRLDVIRWEGDGTISYKSSNTKVVTVSAAGVVTIVGAGTATINVTAAGTKNYNEAKVTANVTVARAANPIKASAKKATVTTTYNLTKDVNTDCNVAVSKAVGTVTYTNASTDATAKTFKVIKTSGKVTVPKKTPAGTYTVKVKATAAGENNYKAGSKTVSYKIVVAKAANPMTVKVASQTASFSTVKKKDVVVACPVTVSNAQGKVTYAKVGGSDALTIHKTSGKVTVKKGTKKGTYSIKIKVTDPGSTNYNKGTKTVTAKVVVK